MRSGQFKSNYHKQLYPVKVLISSMILCLVISGLGKFFPTEGVAKALPTTSEVQVVPEPTLTATPSPTATPISESESLLIEQAVDEFLPGHRSEALMIMHCLAHRESGHGVSKAHGDNGLAGGPFQFHQETWTRMRKQMGEPEGSRYDFKEAARTTAWAISKGRALEWGPILRASNGSNYATCQKPSWY